MENLLKNQNPPHLILFYINLQLIFPFQFDKALKTTLFLYQIFLPYKILKKKSINKKCFLPPINLTKCNFILNQKVIMYFKFLS